MFAPIRLIWGVRLPLVTKVRLISVFASTLVTTAVSLYYIHALLKIGGLTEEYAATIHVRLLLVEPSAISIRLIGTPGRREPTRRELDRGRRLLLPAHGRRGK